MSIQVLLSVEGDGLKGGNTAEPAHFTIKTQDTQGQPVILQGDPLRVEIFGPNGRELAPTVKNNNDGSFGVTYQPQIAGQHDVVVHLRTSVRVGIAVGTSADLSRCYGPGLEEGVQDNLPTYFTIEARGTDGNPMGKGGDPFQVSIKGPKGDVPTEVIDNGDGTYTVKYAPEHAGPHRIDVTLRDKPVDRSPYSVNVREGADHNNSFLEGFQFVIRSCTKSGKSMTRGGENFKVVITGPSGEVPHRLTDNHDGTYLVQYHIEPSAKGDYKFQVTVNGHDILGTPFVVSY